MTMAIVLQFVTGRGSAPASLMPHHAERPTKVCQACGRPFQWRKKWKDVWEEVRYCSDRCRRTRNDRRNQARISA
ncbi:DUF2256 domain-containing protein [Synechococcus sp. CCY9201]|uniref:DUF2256 domain-containing protein n=1 Tax=Synechococcus sp. CCY9201 TaxID=174697 RepID=UPI002B1EB303|nr:DUF2256 domain-containing protein [Synechococcus sp. CCY9201]MEA5474352.1 DUF2256 domain-containing protein [Synechococcus sp. CCY9201]